MVNLNVPEGQFDGYELKDPAWWRKMILTDLFFLCSFVLRYGKKREYRDLNWVHRELCDFLDEKKNPLPQLLVLMFRDSLKSSIARAVVIQWFLQRLAEGTEDKAFYFSGVFDLAQDQLERIVKEIVENPIIQAFFAGIVPKDKEDFEICAIDKGRVRYKRVELDIGSPDKDLTGHHYGLGINDNLVTVVNSRTQEMRKKIVKAWQQQESILAENAREIVFETTWANDDVAGTILDPEGKFDFRQLRRKAAHRFVSETGYAVFSCTAATGEGEIGVPVFPEKVDEVYLRRKRAKQGPATYANMYELQPTADDEYIFKPGWITHYAKLPGNFVRNMAIDCAGTKGRESSSSAISICDWDQDGRLYVAYAEKKKVYPMELYEWFLNLVNLSEEEGRPIFMVGVEREKYGIFLHNLVETNNKKLFDRIRMCLLEIKGRPRNDRLITLQVPYEQGNILSKPGLKDYEGEVKTYFLEKKSGVDILETIFYQYEMKLLPKKSSQPDMEIQARDSFSDQLERDRIMRQPQARLMSRMF